MPRYHIIVTDRPPETHIHRYLVRIRRGPVVVGIGAEHDLRGALRIAASEVRLRRGRGAL